MSGYGNVAVTLAGIIETTRQQSFQRLKEQALKEQEGCSQTSTPKCQQTLLPNCQDIVPQRYKVISHE